MAKSWKIPCRQSEAVNRKRTDNTMAKRKRTKGQTTIFKLLAIVLSVLFRFTASDYLHGIFQLLAIALYVLLRFTASDYRHGIFQLLAIVLSVLLRFTASDYRHGIFQLLAIVLLEILEDTIIKSRKSKKNRQYNGHCIVCSSSIYSF
jgi:hypothetical protein